MSIVIPEEVAGFDTSSYCRIGVSVGVEVGSFRSVSGFCSILSVGDTVTFGVTLGVIVPETVAAGIVTVGVISSVSSPNVSVLN